MSNSTCKLCGSPASVAMMNPVFVVLAIHCDTCGVYRITDWANNALSYVDDVFRARISAYTRERSILNHTESVIVSEKVGSDFPLPSISIHEIGQIFPTKVSDKLERSLLNLSKLTSYLGAHVEISEKDYPVFFAESKTGKTNEMSFIMGQLIEDGYVTGTHGYPGKYTVTPRGWNKVYELEKKPGTESKQAFIAMWFDHSMDEVSENGFKRAIRAAGYEPRRIDDKQHNGKIDDEIIAEIRKSKFVVCDFTGQRGGVYFEAGFAMGLGLPVIWTCRQDEISKVHFDTRQYNHITWENEDDLFQKLLNRINATIL